MTRRRRDVIGLGIAAVITTGIVAPIAAHGGDATRIHACVNVNSGAIKIVDPSASCLPNETPLDWNVAGPKGDKGDQGDAGPQGIPGPQGPAGVAGYQIVRHDKTVSNGPTDAIAFADCPAGKKVLGGGAATLDPRFMTLEGSGVYTDSDDPSRLSWGATVRVPGGGPFTFSVFAICATVTP